MNNGGSAHYFLQSMVQTFGCPSQGTKNQHYNSIVERWIMGHLWDQYI